MTQMTIARRRQPSGTPVGGQFAADARPDADVTLEADDLLDEELELDDAAPAWGEGDEATRWANIHKLATMATRSAVSNTALDNGGFSEDIAQEVTLHLLKREAAVEITPQLVRSAVYGVVARASHANRTGRGRENMWAMSSSDMKAWKIHAARVKETEQILGRALNQNELDEMAKKIRDDWSDPRHRPREDFHRSPGRESTLDETTEIHAPRLSSAEEEYVNADSEGAYMAAALDAVTAEDADGRSKTPERLLHNALAELRGVPLARQGSMSQRRATSARKVVGTTNEAVLAAVEEWAGGADTERTELLFAPYGELSTREKNAVVDMYRERAEFAGALYVSAVTFANNRNADLEDPAHTRAGAL